MEHFEVIIRWLEEDNFQGWVSECEALGVFLDEEVLSKLLRENRLAAETLREIDGKSMDFTLDFKIEVPDAASLIAA